MFGTHDLVLFVASGLLLNVTPGPDTLYILGRTTNQGLRAGAVAALGIGTGLLFHTVIAALGLSAILATSAAAFTILKIVGAAYLVYVGISLIRSAGSSSRMLAAAPASTRLRSVFFQGCLTNVLNPKVALFFLAFLPQFIDPDAPNKALAFLFLGAVFNLNGTLWNLLVACCAAKITGGLRRGSMLTTWLNRCVGSVFVYLGVRLALSRQG